MSIRASHITYTVLCQGATEGGYAPTAATEARNKVLMGLVPNPRPFAEASPAPIRCRAGRPTDLRASLRRRPRVTSPVCNMWPDFYPLRCIRDCPDCILHWSAGSSFNISGGRVPWFLRRSPQLGEFYHTAATLFFWG